MEVANSVLSILQRGQLPYQYNEPKLTTLGVSLKKKNTCCSYPSVPITINFPDPQSQPFPTPHAQCCYFCLEKDWGWGWLKWGIGYSWKWSSHCRYNQNSTGSTLNNWYTLQQQLHFSPRCTEFKIQSFFSLQFLTGDKIIQFWCVWSHYPSMAKIPGIFLFFLQHMFLQNRKNKVKNMLSVESWEVQQSGRFVVFKGGLKQKQLGW